MFRITDDALRSGYLAADFADDRPNITYTAGLQFGNVVVLFSPDGQALVYDPSRSATEMRAFRLAIPRDIASRPIAYQDAMLVPLSNGHGKLLDVVSGTEKAATFQPALKTGVKVKWTRPVAVANGSQFVIADNQKRIYRVELKTGVRPRLVARAETTLQDQVVTELAELNDFVFAVARYDDSDVLIYFSAMKLETRGVTRLGGRVTWGPVSSGGRVLLATSTGTLLCFDVDQHLQWPVDLTHGSPTGEPLVVDSDYLTPQAVERS